MAASVRELFAGATLYEILGVEKTATAEQIKRAYFKKALLWHPDKNEGDPQATKKFQALSWIHSFLSDKAKRKAYDASGDYDEEGGDRDEESYELWYDYWRGMFPAVTEERIAEVEAEYRHSEEEKGDVLAAYATFKGDMDEILNNVMCSTVEDEERFAALIRDAIKAKTVVAFPAFADLYGDGSGKAPTRRGVAARGRASKARKQRATKEADEAEEALEEMRAKAGVKKGSGEDSLTAMILANKKRRMGSMEDILTGMARKYASSAAMAAHEEEDGEEEDEEEDNTVGRSRGRGAGSSSRTGGASASASSSSKGRGARSAPASKGAERTQPSASAAAASPPSSSRAAGGKARGRK